MVYLFIGVLVGMFISDLSSFINTETHLHYVSEYQMQEDGVNYSYAAIILPDVAAETETN